MSSPLGVSEGKHLIYLTLQKKLKNLCFYSKMDSSVAYIPGQPMLIQSSEPVSVFVLTQKLCITMARFLLISKICLIQKLSPKLNVNKLEKILTSLLKTEFQNITTNPYHQNV